MSPHSRYSAVEKVSGWEVVFFQNKRTLGSSAKRNFCLVGHRGGCTLAISLFPGCALYFHIFRRSVEGNKNAWNFRFVTFYLAWWFIAKTLRTRSLLDKTNFLVFTKIQPPSSMGTLKTSDQSSLGCTSTNYLTKFAYHKSVRFTFAVYFTHGMQSLPKKIVTSSILQMAEPFLFCLKTVFRERTDRVETQTNTWSSDRTPRDTNKVNTAEEKKR